MESEEVDFLFDIVITRVELLNPVKEPDKLDAVVKFAGNSVAVTQSRINVSEFENNRQCPFSRSSKDLRNSLETNGLAVSLRYNKSALGSGVLLFPEEFLDKIGPTMSDLYHQDTVSLQRKDDVLGNLSILLVLIVKCADREQNQDEQKTPNAERNPKEEEKVECSALATTVNPQDMLFVIGDPDPLLKIPDKPCSDLPSEEGEERLRLDLQRYRSMNNRRVKFPYDDPCPKQESPFGQLKKLTKEYSQIIDSVAEKVRLVGEPSAMAKAESPVIKTTVTPKTRQEVSEERWLPVPIGSEEGHGIKPTRFCPVCLNSMSWLPKFAPCLKCNTKPRPVLEKMKMTADDIVAEQLVRPTAPSGASDFCMPPCKAVSRRFIKVFEEPMVNSDSDAECPPCRCTCTADKICAHCRIRRLCADVFENEDPGEQSPNPYPQPRSSEDFCMVPGPENDDRPYLSRVFSEMKNLYALHDSKKIEAMRLRCESQTLLRAMSSGRSTFDMRPSQEAMAGYHIPGTFDRQRAGHKNCLPADLQVPRRHGWNWPRSRQARKYGWRPGAILRAAEHVMRFFLSGREESDPYSNILADHEELQQQSSPILNICKRDGSIFVTLRPLANQGIRQKPITFRIVKSQLAVALRQIKRSLKDQGFKKCRCHKSLILCTCRDALEKFELNKALRKECRRRLMEPCPEHLVLTDTSVSDLEFNLDVSPPTKCTMSQVKAIRNTMNHGTQTSQTEQLPMPPRYTMEVPPYYRAFDCALGDRYMNTAFGLPDEQVFEDGVFGMDGGGPHGPNPMPCGRGGHGRRQEIGGIGGRGGPGDGAWRGFPGGKRTSQKGGKSKPIPVRYPKRLLKPAKDAARAAKQAEMDAADKKKKGTDMMKYLQDKGVMRRPWNPNEGKDTRTLPLPK